QGLDELALDVVEAQTRLFRRERRLVVSQVWDLYGDPTAPGRSERTFQFGEAGSKCGDQRGNPRGGVAEERLCGGPPRPCAARRLDPRWARRSGDREDAGGDRGAQRVEFVRAGRPPRRAMVRGRGGALAGEGDAGLFYGGTTHGERAVQEHHREGRGEGRGEG